MQARHLVTGEVYHIFSKSIAGYRIFNAQDDYVRMRRLIEYYRFCGIKQKFIHYSGIRKEISPVLTDVYIEIIAYCFMPTHFHFVLKQQVDQGISLFLGRILNSYTRYFNIKYRRKGPLWESRFKSVHVAGDEQLIHLTRYVHLNPVSAFLVKTPSQWQYSSYSEYVLNRNEKQDICCRSMIGLAGSMYKRFVENHADYQRKLGLVRKLIGDHLDTP
ncbi:MAG TPA: transposase [Candidatus Omnitrophota bacterium]|nr:transposase [Candidatus Omnitrophota bacterium]HPT07067.1 transposase [Candidatus Omnitrophota bacterium]